MENKNLEEMHQYIEDIKRLEGEEDDLISKVNSIKENVCEIEKIVPENISFVQRMDA